MIAAFVLMAVLAALAIAAVVIPLAWPDRKQVLAAKQSNLAVLREAREEIGREFNSGAISQDESKRAMLDLTLRAAEEIEPDPAPPALGVRAARPVLALGIGLGILGLSVVLYLQLGDPIALDPGLLARAAEIQAHPASDPQVLAMVQTLAQRLKSRPNDIEGWTLLGRSEMVLGHFPESAQAYAHVVKIAPPSAELFADYADALAMAQNRRLDGQPFQWVQKALALDPNNAKALELAGSAELARGDVSRARTYWEHLATLLPPGSENSNQVAQALAALDARAIPSKAAADAASGNNVATPHGVTVSGQVELNDALASKVALSDTVFLFARAANWKDKGPKIPLAALRIPARDLPRQFELTDAMALTPGVTLSSVERVVIEAFISKSGRAEPVSGDLIGTSKPVKPGARGVDVVINAVIP